MRSFCEHSPYRVRVDMKGFLLASALSSMNVNQHSGWHEAALMCWTTRFDMYVLYMHHYERSIIQFFVSGGI